LLKKSIRPALKRAGIEGKIIGWHNFRHTLGTILRSIGADIKVAQDLLRHANSRTTLDIYTHAVSQRKRDANMKAVELKAQTFQHLHLSKKKWSVWRWFILKGLLVDLIGIEPMNAMEMQKAKLLTAKWLEVGKTGKTGTIGTL
jgi:hypothetical protein